MPDAGLSNRNNRRLQDTLARERRTRASLLSEPAPPAPTGGRWSAPGPPTFADRAMRFLTLAFLVGFLALVAYSLVAGWLA